MVIAASFGLLLFGCLALVALGAAINKVFPVRQWFVHYVNEKRFLKEVREYIPYLSERDQYIIGYLLAHDQKQFTADQDGGHLTNLISRKIVVYAYQPGQVFRGTDVPMRIPENVWRILQEHKDAFPYTSPKSHHGEVEPQPWRISWMAR